MSSKDTDPAIVGNLTRAPKHVGGVQEPKVDHTTLAPNMPKTHPHLAQVGWLAFQWGIGWGRACRGTVV